jgi:hypothetical protein
MNNNLTDDPSLHEDRESDKESMAKTPLSFRLSHEARRLLPLLAERFGVSQTAIIETQIRMLAKQEGIK